MNSRSGWNWRRTWPLHLLVLPSVVLVLLFNYTPMLGLVMAFQDYKPYLGFTKSAWVGLDHFKFMFQMPDSKQIIWNTLLIASLKIVVGFIVPFVFALLLNEVRIHFLKRSIQTLVYLPHFLSWVILGGILLDMLSIKYGIVNQILGELGIKPIYFLGHGDWFRFTLVVSDTWKEFGFSAIIYLAALAGVHPALYEAAEMDGANRMQQTLHVTIPSVLPIAAVVVTLSLGRVLDGNFEQVYMLLNPLVMSKGDIIDTFVYRTGLIDNNFSFAAAVGVFKSVISFILVLVTYRLAHRYANYRIF
ncbi:ABC transporter permease [Paenibacillus gansuensis]|uniref:ABC transporter permease n=1 Tax=Paenibacillus gansuensis TaxID=306542 RepID=A0ABW5P8Q6_9BACL